MIDEADRCIQFAFHTKEAITAFQARLPLLTRVGCGFRSREFRRVKKTSEWATVRKPIFGNPGN